MKEFKRKTTTLSQYLFLYLIKSLFIYRSMLVGQRPMKSLSPSVCPYVTKFSQDWIISFSCFVHIVMIADHEF